MAGITGVIAMPVSFLEEVKGVLEDFNFVDKDIKGKNPYHRVHAVHFTRSTLVDCFVDKQEARLSICMHGGAETLLKDALMELYEGASYEQRRDAS